MSQRPIEDYSTQELLGHIQYANGVIAECQRKMSGQGGWIAREANQENIYNAQSDINYINAELKKRDKAYQESRNK